MGKSHCGSEQSRRISSKKSLAHVGVAIMALFRCYDYSLLFRVEFVISNILCHSVDRICAYCGKSIAKPSIAVDIVYFQGRAMSRRRARVHDAGSHPNPTLTSKTA